MKKPVKPRSKKPTRPIEETVTIFVFLVVFIAIFAYNLSTAPICNDAYCVLGKIFYCLIGVSFTGYSIWAIKQVK